MGQTFKNNRVWHSYLKNKSPIVIQFKGAPMDSKHSDTRIVFFEIRGDQHDKYYYEVENGTIDAMIGEDVPHNEWIKCTFDGMKEDATITWESAGDSTNAAGSYPTRSANDNKSQQKSFSTGNIVEDFSLCVDEAKQIITDKLGVAVMTVEAAPTVQAMAATLYINWSYTKFTKPLSASMAEGDLGGLRKSVLEALNALPSKNGKAHDGRALKTTLAKMQDGLAGASEVVLDKYAEWLKIEDEFQSAPPEEELTDDLPF